MITPWQKTMFWGFVVAALICLAVVVWCIMLPNPSGDYVAGMGQLFMAIVAGAVAVVCVIAALIARVIHTRAGEVAAGLFITTLVGCYVALKVFG